MAMFTNDQIRAAGLTITTAVGISLIKNLSTRGHGAQML